MTAGRTRRLGGQGQRPPHRTVGDGTTRPHQCARIPTVIRHDVCLTSVDVGRVVDRRDPTRVAYGDAQATGRRHVASRGDTMAYEQTLAEQRGDVLLLTLNRPERLNAWTPKMSAELTEQITAANEDASIGAIVVTGAGRGFCAGADIGGQFAANL